MSDQYRCTDLPALTRQGLYDPQFEHAACGVGLVANIKGVKSHIVVKQGLEVLINLGHRGASGADPNTGDGAGILVQIPHEFFSKECERLGIALPKRGQYGVGVVFLPQDLEQRTKCERIIEQVTDEEGQKFLGWRSVPVSPDAIGTLAARTQPVIKQFFVGRAVGTEDHTTRTQTIYRQKTD